MAYLGGGGQRARHFYMRQLFITLALAGAAYGQTHIVDSAPFPFGNPNLRATCRLVITAPQIVSGASTYWGVPFPYTINGGIDIWLQPSGSQYYAITGQCTYQQPGNRRAINQCWQIPASDSPLAVSDITIACPTTTDAQRAPTVTPIPLSQLSQSGALLNQQPCWNGTQWVAGNCGGGGGTWGSILGTLANQTDLQAALNGKQGSLGFTPENSANRGGPNGYAPLDGSSLVPLANLPNIPFAQLIGVQASLGYTPLNPAANLSDVATRATARANLGLAIGSDVQAWSAFLDTLSGKTLTGNGAKLASSTGSLTAGDMMIADAFGNIVDGGAPGPGSGNVNGPGPVTSGFIATWGASNNLLTAGIAVSATPGADTVVQADGSAHVSPNWFAAASITTAKLASPTGTGANVATSTGTLTTGHGIVIDSAGNLVDSGGAPATGTGNVVGPGTVTNGNLAQWGGSNNTLGTGLPVSQTPAASTVVEADSGGKLAAGWLPFPTLSLIGGVLRRDCGSQFMNAVNADGSIGCGSTAASGVTSVVGQGTANQVLVNGGTAPVTITTTGTLTFTLPQSIHTGAFPQFAGIGFGGAAGPTNCAKYYGTTSGAVIVCPSAAAGAPTMTWPATSGTLVGTGDTGSVSNTMLAGGITFAKLVGTDITKLGTITQGVWNGTAIANANLANSSVTVTAGAGLSGCGAVALGGSCTMTVASLGITNAMLAGSITPAKLSSVTGNGASIVTSTGSRVTGHILTWDASGNAIDGGAPSGGGNVLGPGANTALYLPQWTGVSNTLGAGLPVSQTPGINTVPETDSSGGLTITGSLTAGTTGASACLHLQDAGGGDHLTCAATVFASLGAPVAGQQTYCSDCDTPGSEGATCTSAGDKAGAMAWRMRGAWKCF